VKMFQEVSRNYYDIFKALGVRESPTIEDWVMCTQETYNQVHLQAEEDADIVLRKEWCVIQAALRCVINLLQDGGQSLPCFETEIILVGNDKRLYPSSKLIYIDRMEWRKRCSEIGHEHDLHVVDETLLRSGQRSWETLWHDWDESDKLLRKWDVLCKFTKLRKLSDCVKERLGDGIEDENMQKSPSHSEVKLEKFVKSAEFSRCISILSSARHYFPASMEEMNFFQTLNKVKFIWVLDLHTTLEVKEKKLTATKEEKLAFFINNNLWVKSAQVDNVDVGQQFVRGLASAIASYLCIPLCREDLVVMLEKWNKPPEHFFREFGENFQWSSEVLSQGTAVHDSPGMFVPIEQHRFLVQSTDCSFEVEEIVAVADKTSDGMSSYIFGIVCMRSECKRNESNGKPVAVNGTGLRRLYTVECGGEAPVELYHCDLFKFNRMPNKQFQSSLQQSNNVPSSPLDPQMHFMQEESSAWLRLFDVLKQMETLSEADYRKMLKRLFLEWHPDRCNKPHASRFFQVLRRHEDSYKSDKDFTWLADRCMNIDEALAHTGAFRDQSTCMESRWEYKGAEANSWFAEFEREKLREAELVRQRQEVRHAGSHATTQLSASSHDYLEYDRDLADKYWKMATHFKVKMMSNFQVQRWSDCVWEAQQACEFAIKGLMLRTCGMSTEEKKGKGAHDLLLHMSRLITRETDEEAYPVDWDQLRFLSDAYIHARYPLSGDDVLPTDRYARDDAQKSMTTATVRFSNVNNIAQFNTWTVELTSRFFSSLSWNGL
jgi:HEPN domain-containing protein